MTWTYVGDDPGHHTQMPRRPPAYETSRWAAWRPFAALAGWALYLYALVSLIDTTFRRLLP